MDSVRSETATVVESDQSATSWAAIIAGGVATAALTLVLVHVRGLAREKKRA